MQARKGWLVLVLVCPVWAQWDRVEEVQRWKAEPMAEQQRNWTNADVDGAWDNPNNWNGTANAFSIRTAAYKWTESGSGTSEFYVSLVSPSGATPNIAYPDIVNEDGSPMSEGTLGSLSAGEWAHGNNDSKNFNTLYVRLSDSADPDGKALDFVDIEVTVPCQLDHVVLDHNAVASIVSGQSQPGIELSTIMVTSGYTGDMGSVGTPLELVVESFVYRGSGTLHYIEDDTGKIGFNYTELIIDSDNQDDAGTLYVGETDIVVIRKGAFTIASGALQASSKVYITYRSNPYADAIVTIGAISTPFDQLNMNGGVVTAAVTPTDCSIAGGQITFTDGSVGGGEIAQTGGYVIWNNATSSFYAFVTAGTLDLSQDGRHKTIQDLRVFPGATYITNNNTTIVTGGSLLPYDPIQP